MKQAPRLIMLAPLILILGGAAQGQDRGYTLNAGDVLQITVWKEDGLDREVLVLPDMSISFPLVGTLNVRDKTPTQVQDEIKAGLKSFTPDAAVTVMVKAALGYAVDVIGQVNKPGELIGGHHISVMQALSMAGGLTPYASHGSIVILRRHGETETSIPFPYDSVIQGKSLESDILLEPGDVVVVPNAGLF